MPQPDTNHLTSRVKSLELQLEVLKTQLAHTPEQSKPLSALHGVLRGQSESTESDIAQIAYRSGPDGLL